MSLLIREQTTRSIVDAPAQSTPSNADAEASHLAVAVGRGDEAAFRELYDCHHRRLFRFVLVLGHGDELLAREVVQTVFITAAKKLRSAKSADHLWNWLARVARQQLAKTWRDQKRSPAVIGMPELPEFSDAHETDSVLEESLDSALLVMDAEERKLIELFYFDRLSQKEIAERLNTTPKAVSSRLERARAKLRLTISRRLSHES